MNKELFDKLYAINVNDKTEKKNGLTYLSWTYAISEFTKACPDMTYKRYPYTYDQNLGYMVSTSVTVGDDTKEMWLPVMDGANKAMKDHPYKYITRQGEKTCEAATMMDINKAYMRCLVKNIAMFGLGLYIYAGEDLPEEIEEKATQEDVEKIVSLYDAMMVAKILQYYKVESLIELSKTQVQEVLEQASKRDEKPNKQ